MVTLELLWSIVCIRSTICFVLSCFLDSLSGPIFTSGAQVRACHHRCLCASLPKHTRGGVSDSNRTQLPLQEKPFPPKGNTKTGQTSITITLIKRETKAQHSSRKWTTLQSQNRFKSKLERYGQSCYWTPSAKDKAAQTNRSLVLVSSWALNVAKRHHSKLTQANFSQVNVNKKGSFSLRAFGYLRYNKRGEKKPTRASASEVQMSAVLGHSLCSCFLFFLPLLTLSPYVALCISQMLQTG